MRQRARRQVAELGSRSAVGRRAELAVADYLVANGFDVLERNLRVGPLELDLVAQKGTLVAIVEVRTRGPGALEGAFESVGASKRARIMRAAERLWRERLSAAPGIARVRIDVAAVTFDGDATRVEYVAAAITG